MKTFVCLIFGALAFSTESLRTSDLSHEVACLTDSGCYDMANCNWSVDQNWRNSKKGNYYPNCNWKRECECNKCLDNTSECASFFGSVSSSDQDAENAR